jgi:hypothetical protein
MLTYAVRHQGRPSPRFSLGKAGIFEGWQRPERLHGR